ncbi:sensor histidine kinase [Mycolicibacterium gadium]|uniref:histidine kinase n=1 Tax=Mycolicibacterium gadium TaxID=1794 RepID=A0A7I7WG98_MYCGU|nr:HAMP domain-containing sensor histidine kinase [Mycolicibacterium gadium]BBZ15892.1 hypothetical protein MGAD_02270 [Mycolicibacterium gadium]
MAFLARWPIRWRLTLVFAVVMAVVLTAAGAATVLQFRDAVAEGDPTGALREATDDITADLTAELAVILPAVLAVAILAAYRLSRAALAPVDRMRAAAETISTAPAASTITTRLPMPTTNDEIARLADTLNTMLARLHTALDRERQFVADASHELRTPLSLLTTEIELALRRPRNSDELRAALHSALDETKRLTGLADDLLTLSHAELSATRDETTTILPVIDDIAARFAATGAHVTVHATPELRVAISADDLRRVLTALLDNATRHGGGDITITATEHHDSISIHVQDHGPGFPPEFLPVAFHRFTRADTARTSAGSGLGLAIAANLAAAYGGQAHASNKPDGGADISITLPTSSG